MEILSGARNCQGDLMIFIIVKVVEVLKIQYKLKMTNPRNLKHTLVIIQIIEFFIMMVVNLFTTAVQIQVKKFTNLKHFFLEVQHWVVKLENSLRKKIIRNLVKMHTLILVLNTFPYYEIVKPIKKFKIIIFCINLIEVNKVDSYELMNISNTSYVLVITYHTELKSIKIAVNFSNRF
ncbi:hypothetical protein AGLY_005194 [Aphis glycines]|uniref:Transmembrane protein n=1 Tax=Aphis glycines TaxID=307491 RepID=A0A6G0TW34_APHGL|nr:hypothetical protein AGLY_005194 [Aphis glycines]